MGEVVQQNWDFRNWKARANTQSRGNEVLLNGNLAVLNAIKACLLFFFPLETAVTQFLFKQTQTIT